MVWETRRHERKPLMIQIRVQVSPAYEESVHLAKESVEAQVLDISSQGLGCLSPVFLPHGLHIDFEFPRAVFALEGKLPPQGAMKITGEVVYARPQGDHCKIGVSFTQIDESDRSLIQQFCSAKERRRSPRFPGP